MPITANPALYPSLTFEQANPFLAGGKYALGMGTDLSNIITQNLEQQKARATLPFAGPQAQANLSKTQLENQWYPALQKSLINMQGAHAGLFGQEAAFNKQEALGKLIENVLYNQKLKELGLGSLMPGYPANQQPQQMQPTIQQPMQQPQQAIPQNMQPQPQTMPQQNMLNPSSMGLPQQNNAPFGDNIGQSLNKYQNPLLQSLSALPQQGQGDSIAQSANISDVKPQSPVDRTSQPSEKLGSYGIKLPDVSLDDYINKKMGIDTISQKQSLYKDQVQHEYNAYMTDSVGAANTAESSNDQMKNLNLWNQYMNKASALTEAGVVGGRVPVHNSLTQAIDNLQAKMTLPAVRDMKEAAGGGKFFVAEMGPAIATKPNRTWNDAQRTAYTKMMKLTTARANEKAAFFTAAGDPDKGIPNKNAHALWNEYVKRYPIVTEKGFAPQNLNHFNEFLTPDARDTLKKTGEYNPIKDEHFTKENIEETKRQNNWTTKQFNDHAKKMGYNMEIILKNEQ